MYAQNKTQCKCFLYKQGSTHYKHMDPIYKNNTCNAQQSMLYGPHLIKTMLALLIQQCYAVFVVCSKALHLFNLLSVCTYYAKL